MSLSQDLDKFTFYTLPLLCEIFSLYNGVLVSFGFRHVYLIFYFVALFFLIRYNKRLACSGSICSIPFYIYYVIIAGLVGYVYLGSFSIIMGMLTYILPVIYWFLYTFKGGDRFWDIIYSMKYHVLIISIFALLQFFVSPTLWGIIMPVENSGNLGWAAQMDPSSYAFFFRPSSLLPSPQYLGMFMGLYIVFFNEIRKSNRLDILLLLSYIPGGVISGNKSFLMITGIYVIYKIIASRNLKLAFGGMFIFIILFLFSIPYLDDFGFIARNLDVNAIMDDEQDGRLATYSRVLANISFWGHGTGIVQNIGGNNMSGFVAESYIFQILHELGICGLILFCFFLYESWLRSNNKILIFCIILSMIVVHCFNGFVLFIFWGYLFINKQKTIVNCEKTVTN